jgi:cytochrome c peroxidase
MKAVKTILVLSPGNLLAALLFAGITGASAADGTQSNLDQELRAALAGQGFTGRVESTLEQRLGRLLHRAKADLGRLLFFDKFVGLHGDNSCAGCHAPLNGFGDSQSIAIGVENNDFVGPRRSGPLTGNTGLIAPVLQRIDPALAQRVSLTGEEFSDLEAFLRDGLLDRRALPENRARLIPTSVPSGLSLPTFESTPTTQWSIVHLLVHLLKWSYL